MAKIPIDTKKFRAFLAAAYTAKARLDALSLAEKHYDLAVTLMSNPTTAREFAWKFPYPVSDYRHALARLRFLKSALSEIGMALQDLELPDGFMDLNNPVDIELVIHIKTPSPDDTAI